MYIAKKRLQRTKQQFKRENDFGYPVHKSDKETPERAAFISALIQNKEFYNACVNNYEKFKDPVRVAIKKFSAFDYFCITMFTICAGSLAFGVAAAGAPNDINTVKTVKLIGKRIPINCIVWAAVGLLAGLGIGVANQVSLGWINKDSDEENLYVRLSVRLFDLMREKYPDLDENVLKACNPEMARVIKALMITNMSESDIREIQSIAYSVSKQLHHMTPDNEKSVIINCDRELKNALSIIEQNLITNQNLCETILAVYHGNIPLKFSLKDKQNTK